MAKDKKEKSDAPKAELSPEEQAAKSKKKKLLIIIIAGVIGTVAIGAGLAMFLSKGSAPTDDPALPMVVEAEPPSVNTPATAAPAAKPAEKSPNKAATPDATAKKDSPTERPKLPGNADIGCTTPLKSFNLNLGNPLENRYIRLELAIEHGCAEEEKNEVTERMPQLRDAIISVTSKKTREFLLSPDGKTQLTYEIRNQLNQRMSRPIKDVYITDILIE